MTEDGKIINKSYDKYKQINRYIELIDDFVKEEKELTIVDFGCGKSYLTFITYYYVTNILKIPCTIMGFDLKEQVIKDCNKLAEKYGYSDNLKFYCDDIKNFKYDKKVDLVISLHACDTATDLAIEHALNIDAKYIYAVPCCHKEINKQLSKKTDDLVLKYGINKERFSTILTDNIRASIIESFGYDTQVIEFIDIAHSPKNVLIRAKKQQNVNTIECEKIKNTVDMTLKKYNITQTLFNNVCK